ncbi:MAG: c-type cytochrome biogenesis protein CcmF, partial [Proteobacteria bacterium]
QLLPYLIITTLLAVIVWSIFKPLNIRAIAGIYGGLWVFTATLGQWFKHPGRATAGFIGMSVAHIGVAVFLFSMSMTEHKDIEQDILMQPGTTKHVGGYDFTFTGVDRVQQENYQAQQGHVEVHRDGRFITVLNPQKRFYPKQQMPMTEAAIYAGWTKDIYVSLGEAVNKEGAWAVRIYIKPLIRWMWFGGILMLSGAIIGLFSARIKRQENNQRDRVMEQQLNLS